MKLQKHSNGTQAVVEQEDAQKAGKMTIGVSAITESPIPTPEQLEGYQRVLPDMPERILRQFEADSEHARNSQMKALQGDLDFDKRSQWMAFVIILMGLFITFLLAYLDKDVAAIVTGLGTASLIFKGTFSRQA